jgi:hypothetical protein
MPQFMPQPQGLYPYKNAGINDYEGFGNMLQALIPAIQAMKQRQQGNQTFAEMMGVKPTQTNLNPNFRASNQSETPNLRTMTSPLQALAMQKGQQFQTPQQYAQTTPNPVFEKMGPMANVRRRDLGDVSSGINSMRALSGMENDPTQLLIKQMLAGSAANKNEAIADYYKKRPTEGGSGSPKDPRTKYGLDARDSYKKKMTSMEMIIQGIKPNQIDELADKEGEKAMMVFDYYSKRGKRPPPIETPQTEKSYQSADEVKQAYQSGTLSKEEAKQLLQGFGFK